MECMHGIDLEKYICIDCEKIPSVSKSASVTGSDACLNPASDYTDKGLVQLALELHARACVYMTKELHDRATEAKLELLKRLKERH